MNQICKAILFGGRAIVTVINSTDMTNTALKLHNYSDEAGEIFARAMAISSFLCAGIKGTNIKLSTTIEGDGKLGKIIICGQTGGYVRGYIENGNAIVNKNVYGRADTLDGIGSNGYITVIKDFGLKEPYVGKVQLMTGNLDADFSYYFTVSEQLPSAVSSGAIVENGVCKAAGAIIVQPMPNCDENIITVLEDIVTNFVGFENLLLDYTPEEIIDKNFGHFECKFLQNLYPDYKCNCSQERMDNIVTSLGRTEAENILDELGTIEIHCDFCNKYYRYNQEDINTLYGG